ncbi:hypothetical protein [Sanguibacter massiliensis]|uniref:hypothetical protein n=1 Tax=Sanguibacter massiliensis TaxID=1973217 RepID=UPI000C818E4D|nr:hypothetical protein [Sanguibacter massiliensis]
MNATITDVFALNERAGFYAGPGQVRFGYLATNGAVEALYDVDVARLESLWDTLATGLLDAGARRGAAQDAGIVVVAFDDAGEASLGRIEDVLVARGMSVAIAARVDEGRVLTLDSSGVGDVETARVWTPRTPLATLEEVAANLVPAEDPYVDEAWVSWARNYEEWRTATMPGTSPTARLAAEVLETLHLAREADVARAGVRLLDRERVALLMEAMRRETVRDHVVVHLVDARTDLTIELAEIARHAPENVRQAMCAAAGAAVYARGNQALARCYAEAAPADPLGQGVLAAAQAGMSPQSVLERVVEAQRPRMAALVARESAPALTQQYTLETTYEISTQVETEYAIAGPIR